MDTHDLVINFIVASLFAFIGSLDVTNVLQIISYSTSIAVGAITIYKFFKKRK